MGMKQLPKRSGEYLFEIIMRRYETGSTLMTSNRPLEDWGKLIGDVPSAAAILDRFLHHAEIVQITGKSYRLRHQTAKGKEAVEESKPANAPTGSERVRSSSKPANAPTGSEESLEKSKPAKSLSPWLTSVLGQDRCDLSSAIHSTSKGGSTPFLSLRATEILS
jgi:hypothetical protein